MFFHKIKSKSAKSAIKRNQSRTAQFESLEDRKLMTTTHIVLDFTPDNRAGSFYDTFRYTKDSRGVSPAFMDFNKDGSVSKADASIAAGQIAARVEALFGVARYGQNVKVGYGDVLRDTNMGSKYVNWGLQRRNDQVQVIFVGGRNTGELGRAPLAANGTNVEGWGCAYSQQAALTLWQRQSVGKRVESRDFVYSVASTVAHELGHMYGLRHGRYQYSNDIMNPVQSSRAQDLRFISNNRQTTDGTYQSPLAELSRSFNGQRTYHQTYGRGSYQMPAGEAEHGDRDDHCDHDAAIGSTAQMTVSPIDLNALTAKSVDHLYGNPQAEFSKYAIDLSFDDDHSELAQPVQPQTFSNDRGPELKGSTDRGTANKHDSDDGLFIADWRQNASQAQVGA
jgi:hypothetical protein